MRIESHEKNLVFIVVGVILYTTPPPPVLSSSENKIFIYRFIGNKFNDYEKFFMKKGVENFKVYVADYDK